MISERDVIKVYLPFPNVDAQLAKQKHYYICNLNNLRKKHLFKCQRFKPSMLSRGIKDFGDSYYRVNASPAQPFKQDTVIDKKKVFQLLDTIIPLEFLNPETPKKLPEVTYNSLTTAIQSSSPQIVSIDKKIFIELNQGCS